MRDLFHRIETAFIGLPDWLWVLLAVGMCYALVKN